MWNFTSRATTTAAAAASTTVGGSDTTSPDTTSPDTTSPDTTDASGATTRVNANDASVEELAAAFEAAGIPNAARWAHEVEEYRPYSDDGWAHLRQELSKYNIDDATFEQIVATLSGDWHDDAATLTRPDGNIESIPFYD